MSQLLMLTTTSAVPHGELWSRVEKGSRCGWLLEGKVHEIWHKWLKWSGAREISEDNAATIVWRSSLAGCSARVVSRDVVVLTTTANCLETVKDVVVNPEVEMPSTHVYLLVQTRAFLRHQPWQRRSGAKVHGARCHL